MTIASVPRLLETVRQQRLLKDDQLGELTRLSPKLPDGKTLARELLKRGWMTPYQANQLLQGRGAELVMGAYLVLERLGEGGTGQVFKAQHRRMERVVALKLIRPELLADGEVVARFYREVQSLSQLSHPNIVHAFDAGPLGSAHFLVMEYVEGTDLNQLVKKNGPLPLDQACNYISQAAQGLQHVCERGLIHRDIKPSNLLVTRDVERSKQKQDSHSTLRSPRSALVKILDLGLARLLKPVDGELTQNLTPVGSGAGMPSMTMGTPDYLAPEQAIDFHEVDIRADIYSLGCTFFYILTGKPPFPAGTLAQKLMRHQQAPPPALSTFRADVPPALEAVLQRMLAKKPAERYQKPSEVVTAINDALAGTAPRRVLPTALSPVTRSGGRRRLLFGAAAMLMVFVMCSGWLLSGLYRGQASSTSADGTASPAGPGNLDPSTPLPFAKLAQLIRPSPDEELWLAIGWLSDLWEARQRAAASGKPILLWDGSGHPLGCACNSAIAARAYAFADPEISRMAQKDFIRVATDDWYERRRTDQLGQFFLKMAVQGPRKNTSYQGIYCLTADGKFLSYTNSGQNINSVRSAIQQGLDEWNKLPDAQRKPGAVVVGDPGLPDSRFRRVLPAGGRAFDVFTRILERDSKGEWSRGTTKAPGGNFPGRDHLWITVEEEKALVPRNAKVGDTITVPARVQDRILRFHLVDNTRGEPGFWKPDEVQSQTWKWTVVQSTPAQVLLQLEATALLATAADASKAERGYAVQLQGRVAGSPGDQKLLQADIVAIGDYWDSSWHGDTSRPSRKPLGIAFSLGKGQLPADLVPPGAARDLQPYWGGP